jgi:hypothetical protein
LKAKQEEGKQMGTLSVPFYRNPSPHNTTQQTTGETRKALVRREKPRTTGDSAMKGKQKEGRQTVTLGVPFYPTPQAEAKLLHGIQVSDEIRDTVACFLERKATGKAERLLDVAQRPAVSHARRTHRVPHLTQAQLLAQLREARDVRGWGEVLPASTINLIGLDALAAALQPPGRGKQNLSPRLDLDGGLWAIDPFRVCIHALGDDAVQWADNFALPSAYGEALKNRQGRHLQGEKKRMLHFQQRFLGGEQDALAECIRIGGRVQPGDLEHRPEPFFDEEPDQPRALERTAVQQVRRPGGEIGWEISMTFSMAGTFSGTLIADTVGIDVGADLPLAWASGTETGTFAQNLLWLPVPAAPTPGLAHAPTPYDHHLGQAWGRRLILEALRAGYEDALRRILRYERIVLEDIDWTGFNDGFAFAEFAEHAHLHTFIGWLKALAPLYGNRVVPVDPRFTSRTCSRCGWVNERRPLRGELFVCERPCGHVQVSHLNAALVARSRVEHPTRTGW